MMLWCISPFICFDLLKMARNCLALNFTSTCYPKPIFVEYFLLNILRQGYPGEDIFLFLSRQLPSARNLNDFFLAMAGNLHILAKNQKKSHRRLNCPNLNNAIVQKNKPQIGSQIKHCHKATQLNSPKSQIENKKQTFTTTHKCP